MYNIQHTSFGNTGKRKKDYFDVAIKILGCGGLSTQIKDLSTQIKVQIGDEKHYSKVIHHTTKPFFDDYFVFTKFMAPAEFMDALIVISVMHIKRRIRLRKLIGCITMDVATVWNQPNRQLKKWFSVSLPSDRSAQRRAFVECDLRIVAPLAYHEWRQLSSFESSEIIGSKRARYKVLIHRCTGLQPQGGLKLKDQEVTVRAWFAGKSEKTSVRKLSESVEWNEQITFLELFPPMRQRLTVELRVGKKVIATKNFIIIEFFKIFHSGFLNMFGPTYIHLYTENYVYRGSLLMALESEILGQLREFEYATGVTLTTIEPISQIKYGINKTFVCCGIVFDLIITKTNCGKDNIYLSMDMGSTRNIESKRYSAKMVDIFLHVHLGKKKPCISLTCDWPDCTHRLYNSNVLSSLCRQLKDKLEAATKAAAKGCMEDARDSLVSACHAFKKDYKKHIKLMSNGITELDAKKTTFLKDQLKVLAALLADGNTLQNVTELCRVFHDVLGYICQEIQDVLPLLQLNLCQGKKTIGSCMVHPRDIIYSDVKEKRGLHCGKIHNLCLKGKSGELVARMDVWLWLGKREHIDKCRELFPAGHEPYTLPKKISKLPLPHSLKYDQTHTYTAICHIHSGFIDEEAAHEGDCDSFVRVSFLNRARHTITAKRTLAPTWKETLILKEIKLHLPLSYLVENPPQLTVEFWNDTAKPPKLMGTGLVDSNVRPRPATNVTEFPLKWWSVGEENCEVLLACEIFPVTLQDHGEEKMNIHRHCNIIPRFLEPPNTAYRLEVIFWGIRPLYARHLKNIIQPQISIQFATVSLFSGVIARANTTFNFHHDSRIVKLNLPQVRLLAPPLLIKVMSNFKYLMMIAEKNIYRYEYELPKKSQWNALTLHDRAESASHQVTFPDLIPQKQVSDPHRSSLGGVLVIPNRLRTIMSDLAIFSKFFDGSRDDESSSSDDDELEQDWWDRYWNNQMSVYENTLEDQEEFSGFNDVLSTFTIKKKRDEWGCRAEIGKLKAVISLYKWPPEEPTVTMQGQDPETGILKLSNLYSRVNLLVRVYCVKATDLYPSDLNGKSDPYIEIATQSKTVSDKINKILCELNPVFGNHHDITATLPVDNLLSVRVMDWDAFSRDDIIGETIIDIENRFYSRHRATCGLPDTFATAGPGAWRDIETPKEILERLCNAHNLPLPQYNEKSVTIGSKEFLLHRSTSERDENEQRLALVALNNWKDMPLVGRPLVGEHVETRNLYKEDRPGLVRGKLTMWVDMFDTSLGTVPLPIEIIPRSPQGFELRVNILNTARIPLVDSVGDRKCTDIVVTGWLGSPKTAQKTDVHHKSYTGTGNFNWRFVFPFLYYRKENVMVFSGKNLFDIGKTEVKVPCVLHLEVHDSEGMLEDAFLGGMMLELCRMAKGARSYRNCTAEQIYSHTNVVDLFKVERLKGWWPFLVDKTTLKERGFLEAEFFLITAEEARRCPVGLGRSPPDPLPLPPRVRGRRTPCQVIEHLLLKPNFQSFFGFSLNLLIVLSLIVLIGLLIYTLPSTFEKLKPWFEETL